MRLLPTYLPISFSFGRKWVFSHFKERNIPLVISCCSQLGVNGYQSIWHERKDTFDSEELLLWHGVMQQIDGDKVIVLFVTACIETSG